MKNNIETLLINFIDWLEQKIYKKSGWGEYRYHRLKRWIKHHLYTLKIYAGIFKLPKVLRSYNSVLDDALTGLKYYKESIDERNDAIRYLLDRQVEITLGDTDYSEEQKTQAYRDAYLDDRIANIYNDDMKVFELAPEHMTEEEYEDWFERQYEHQREVACHCYDSIEDIIKCEFDNGPLVKGGWYENKPWKLN